MKRELRRRAFSPRVNAYMIGDSFGARSLSGRVDSSQQTMTLQTVDQSGANVRISAVRQ